MPVGWRYGNWKFTSSSQPAYAAFVNVQWDLSPSFPQSATIPGQDNDVASFQIAGDPSGTILTLYGIDTPRLSNDPSIGSGWADVYDWVGAGAVSTMNNSIEVIAWGYDTDGIPYTLVYETPITDPAHPQPADIDVASRSDSGPSQATLTEVFAALSSLGNQELSDLIGQVVPLVQNGARDGQPPVTCDATCMSNSDFPWYVCFLHHKCTICSQVPMCRVSRSGHLITNTVLSRSTGAQESGYNTFTVTLFSLKSEIWTNN